MGFRERNRPESTPNPAAREVWRRWFATDETSIEEALRVYEIDTDTDEDEDNDSPAIGVTYQYFVPRPRQVSILKTIEDTFWNLRRRAARLVCLKARRYGLTTFFLLLGLTMILRVPGYNVALVAQDDDSTQEHFSRVRDFFSQIPKWVLAERGIEVVQDTHQRLILRHAGNRTSRFRIATAKRKALGRGMRNNMLILTEFPVWEPSAKRDLTGILKTCKNVRGNAVIFESTAQGHDEFYRRYKRAKKRLSSYRAVFVASHENPTNRKAFESAEAEIAFIASIGTLPEFGTADELILFRRLTVDLKWTPSAAAEYLNWRREEIADECEGVISYFKREEPNTEDEAFQGTGLPLFRKDILDAHRDAAEKREEAATRVRLLEVKDKIELAPETNGEFTVFSEPEDGARYAFGADVASGVTTLADGKSEADYSVIIVKDVDTRITVARYRSHIDPMEFASVIFRTATYYNEARGFIERAINEAGVCLTEFERLEWDRNVDYLLSQRFEVPGDHAVARKNYKFTPGFQTTPKSKPRLIANIHKLVKDTGIPDGTKPCPWDIFFIDEAMKFERVKDSTRMEAVEGHDDVVMSEGICLEAINVILEDPDERQPETKSKAPEGPHMKLLRHAAREAADRESEGDGKFNDVPGLPGF